MISQIDGEEAFEDTKEAYEIFDKNTKALLECQDIQQYLLKHKEMCQSQDGVLECFDITDTDELQQHIEQNEISFDELKIATALASKWALENIIYEAEEDEY